MYVIHKRVDAHTEEAIKLGACRNQRWLIIGKERRKAIAIEKAESYESLAVVTLNYTSRVIHSNHKKADVNYMLAIYGA